MRGLINAGHCRATATVLRTVETRDGYKVCGFRVFGAMALAAIGRLPSTIEDRAVKLAMRRRRPDEPVAIPMSRLSCMTAPPTIGGRCLRSPIWPGATGLSARATPP
jgi:hypothetical protein